MVSIRKRGAVYGVIALMLVVAAYLNWSYVRTPDDLTVANQVSGQSNTTTDITSTTTQNGEEAVTTQVEASSDTSSATVVSSTDYFAQSRLSREQARDEAISILKETVENDKSDEKSKTEASDKISALAENSVQEARVESLIKAKGYVEAVVFIGDDSVNVIVQPPEGGLQSTDASKIRDIVVSETNMGADKIKIVEAA